MQLRLFIFLLFCGALLGAQDRIPGSVDPSRTVAISRHLHASVQAAIDRGPVDQNMPIAYASLLFTPGAGIESFLAEQQNPLSPNYHKWLTPEQFADRFGLTQADVAKVRAWLESQGLTVHDVARGRHWITFSGTAGSVGRAFHTEIHRYVVNGAAHFANAAAPQVPAALAGVVAGVEGLTDFGLHPMNIRGAAPEFNSGSSHYLAPDDLATIYDIAPLYAANTDGTGQKIAVIGQTDVALSDIHLFRNRFGLAANDPKMILYGPDPGTSAVDLTEADIDLEWSGAIARNAQILYVYAKSVETAAKYAVDQNLAPVMTLSYGECEPESTMALRGVAQQANAEGITWFIASGDSGATQCDDSSPTPQATKGTAVAFPASLPEVTAVGGTEFNEETASGYWASSNSTTGASALQYVPERVWNDAALTNRLEGGGGGASGYFEKPSWQNGPGVPSDGARDLPDVSLPASPYRWGYFVYTGGNLAVFGGTSVGSPVFAGIAALLNHSLTQASGAPSALGNINPILYRLAQSTSDVFHDVATGDNKMPCAQGSPGCVGGLVGYAAGPNYDMGAGLGSVDVTNLVKEWTNGTTSTTTLSAAPDSVLLSDTVALTATVAGNGTVAPTGTVSFTANDADLGSATLSGSGGSATASVSVAASAIAAGSGTVSAVYGGDGVYAGSTGSASVSLKLPASGALVVPSVNPNPIYQLGYDAGWHYTLTLTEKAGVSATLTGFTINGNNDLSLFSTKNIPAHGSISAAIISTGLTPPVNRVFVFTGTDATGQSWTQQVTGRFVAPLGPVVAPGMTLTSATSTVQNNPNADSSCQWAHSLILQETGGFEITLSKLTVSGVDMSSRLQSIFGTQRLAPYGMLQGTVCYPSTTSPTTKTYAITGISEPMSGGESGVTVTASLSTPLVAAPASAAQFTASANTLNVSAAADGAAASGTVDLTFTGGSPQWTTSVSPANRISGWLTATASGSGSGQVQIQASPAGLSAGVYSGVVTLQAQNAVPQSIAIPVTLTVAPSSTTKITGLQNAFSFHDGFAPGMALSIYGTKLAPATTAAPKSRFPLPLTLSGVSATVNGISAPIYYVSPGQINIQVPYETGSGPAVVAVNNNGEIAAFPFTVQETAPGLYQSAISNSTGLAVTSAAPGDLLLLFVTGEGDVTPSLETGATPSASITDPNKLPHARLPISVTIGGVSATPIFAGIPSGIAGVTQIDVYVPAGVAAGAQPVVATVGSVASPAITLNVTASAGQ